MLVTLGRRVPPEDVVDLLAECHARIRRFLVMARHLAEASPGTSPPEIAATAGQIRRYFDEAFRLHVEDEERDIAPMIPELFVVRMHADHVANEHDVAELVAICAELERCPEHLGDRSRELDSVAVRLSQELEAHLEFEERTMFPALRQLDAQKREAIRDAMRARRERALGMD